MNTTPTRSAAAGHLTEVARLAQEAAELEQTTPPTVEEHQATRP